MESTKEEQRLISRMVSVFCYQTCISCTILAAKEMGYSVKDEVEIFAKAARVHDLHDKEKILQLIDAGEKLGERIKKDERVGEMHHIICKQFHEFNKLH